MTRDHYLALFKTSHEAIANEESILSIGHEFLPPEALAVLSGEEPTPAYWDFLISQSIEVDA